ncbi:dTDP-4-dehydrorhamnose reductase [Thiomicrorhabdus aquaedulcis]|uniref:dTDP-4-dehydrorhamnose reductase n=1 Tax=Thiomicrorhabdus aquaedulcis TaxID=2211106 RepID=UPI000FDA4252|nr:dTDP-4-dehydrorhamnose reductase [Thiomicrorhabdus aquaedulcis]
MSIINILVLGAHGQLGQAFNAVAGEFVAITLHRVGRELDITQPGLVSALLAKNQYDAVINCAAFTDVNAAEQTVASAQDAYALNHLAVASLAHTLKLQGGFLVHFSTDYVFDGNAHKPYTEHDTPYPINVYGQSKLKGEQAMLKSNPPGLVIRTSWLFSPFGKNFVTHLLNVGRQEQTQTLNIVSDQVGSPTSALDLARAVLQLLTQRTQTPHNQAWLTTQLLHFANAGQASWAQLASAVVQQAQLNCTIHPILTHQYSSPVKRPAYSVLNTQSLQTLLNTPIRSWQDALQETLNWKSNAE